MGYKKMKKISVILIIISFFIGGFAQAAAVKVKPSEVRAEVKSGVLARQEIIIENPDDNVAFYEVYLDNFSNWIKIKPESFILESGEFQQVVLEIENEETGVFSTVISVVAKPLSERKFKANSGVKIPLEIRIVKEEKSIFLASIFRVAPQNWIWLFGILLTGCMVGFFLVKYFKKREFLKKRIKIC